MGFLRLFVWFISFWVGMKLESLERRGKRVESEITWGKKISEKFIVNLIYMIK